MNIRKPREDDVYGLIRLSAKFAGEHDWAKDIPIGKIDDADKARERLFGSEIFEALVAEEESVIGYVGVKKYEDRYEASILVDSDCREKFLEKEFIPGKEFYVYVFTRNGEKE